MADTKISALAGVAAVAGANEFAVNEAGASKKASATQLATFMSANSGWRFLGTATGATVTVGPVIWTGTYNQFMFEYLITGYNGGTPVGRVLIGSASISTTALNNGNNLMSGVTLTATSVSVPGCPLAVTLSNIARSGSGYILGPTGSFKQMTISGQNGNPAAATSPTQFHASSFFTDLGTNLVLQRMQLTVYDTVTATAVSAQTFSTGTFITVWGRNND